MAKERWFLVGDSNSIPLGEGKKVSFEDFELGVFNTGKGFFAIDNRCPHRQGPLSDGIISGKTVYCPLHNWNIDLESGCAMKGGEGQVKSYPVKIEDSKIYICF